MVAQLVILETHRMKVGALYIQFPRHTFQPGIGHLPMDGMDAFLLVAEAQKD